MESKLLELNLDKSCFIVLGSKKTVNEMKSELKACPLPLCGKPMKEKVSDKYLGDLIHSHGPSASVESTISERYGRTIL